jgi:hypothetical protein
MAMVGDHTANPGKVGVLVFNRTLEPMILIAIDDQAALVKLLSVLKICFGCECEILIGLEEQRWGIIISETIVSPLPQVCVGLRRDPDAGVCQCVLFWRVNPFS